MPLRDCEAAYLTILGGDERLVEEELADVLDGAAGGGVGEEGGVEVDEDVDVVSVSGIMSWRRCRKSERRRRCCSGSRREQSC